MEKKLLILGLGNMGYAILKGILNKNLIPAKNILGVDLDLKKLQNYQKDLGIKVAHFDNNSWLEFCEKEDNVQILLSVKPYDVEKILNHMDEKIVKIQNKIFHFISICAGLEIAKIESYIQSHKQKVTRVMPNLPLLVGEGASAISFNDEIHEEDKKFVIDMFSSMGLAMEVEEKYMDAVTGISGSGPGYVCLFIEAMADAGVRAGLSRPVALKLASQTLVGTAKLLLKQDEHPGVLKDKICSPGGTTIEAIYAAEKAGLRYAVMKAVDAVVKRSKELA